MTILGVKNQLVTHFLTHDTFSLDKNAFDITYDPQTAVFREELTREALKALEESGFVKRLSKDEEDIWVLVQPIGAYAQQVTISPIIADMIASVVNFHNELDSLDYIVDKTKIDEGAIARLLNIVSEYDDVMIQEAEKRSPSAPQEERE